MENDLQVMKNRKRVSNETLISYENILNINKRILKTSDIIQKAGVQFV